MGGEDEHEIERRQVHEGNEGHRSRDEKAGSILGMTKPGEHGLGLRVLCA
jgi:hypothetical protein